MTKPNDKVSILLPGLSDKTRDLLHLQLAQHTNEIEGSSWPWLKTSVQSDERVLLIAHGYLVHVRARILLALHRVVGVVVLPRVGM